MMMIETEIDRSIEPSEEEAALVPAQAGNASEGGVILLNALLRLAYRWRLVAALTGVGFACGLFLALVLPAKYTAVTKIMPPQQAPSSVAMMMAQAGAGSAGSLGAIAAGGLSLRNPNAIYIGMLNSRPVADSIIGQFGLMDVYHSRDMTAARLKLAKNTEVTSEKEGYIAVSVTDGDKKRVAQIANCYADQLRQITQELAVSEADQRRRFYEGQLNEEREALIKAEVAFQKIQQSNNLVELDAQTKAAIESLALLRAQITAREVALQAMRSYSTERNPDVEVAERELSSLRDQERRMQEGNPAADDSALSLKGLSGKGLEYLRAEHELKYRQAIFDLLIKQYDAARLDESKQAAVIQVLEPAIEPDRRTSPKPLGVILLTTFSGFLVACMLVWLLGWKETLQSNLAVQSKLAQLGRALGH